MVVPYLCWLRLMRQGSVPRFEEPQVNLSCRDLLSLGSFVQSAFFKKRENLWCSFAFSNAARSRHDHFSPEEQNRFPVMWIYLDGSKCFDQL